MPPARGSCGGTAARLFRVPLGCRAGRGAARRPCVARNRILFDAEEGARLRSSVGLVLPAHDDRARHMHQVLGVACGDDVRVGVLDEGIGLAEVVEDGRGKHGQGAVCLRVTAAMSPPDPPPPLVLLLACPRPKVARRLIEKIVQIGVRRVVVSGAERVERGYLTAKIMGSESVMDQVIKGLEQAGDCMVPEILVSPSLKCALRLATGTREGTWGWRSACGRAPERDVAPPVVKVLCHPDDNIDHTLYELLSSPASAGTLAQPGGCVCLAIGPEGGWTPPELDLFEAEGWTRATLGGRTLTTDTAVVALMAVAQQALTAARRQEHS